MAKSAFDIRTIEPFIARAYVKEDRIREVIQGKASAIGTAFMWHYSPQGSNHWYRVGRGERALSKRSKRWLNAVLNRMNQLKR